MSLTLGLLTEHLRLDPAAAAGCAFPVIAPLYQPLLHIDCSGDAPVPDLAERWEVAADGCSHRFWLRDASFHDGSPLRVRDVAWSLSRHMWPSSTSLFGPVLRGLLKHGGLPFDGELADSFEIDESQRCLTIRLVAPYVPLPELLSHPMLGAARETADGLVGSGPLVARRDGDAWQFTTNEAYRGPRASQQALRLVGYKTPVALRAALEQQEIDAVSIERVHQPLFADRFACTSLKDRWVGALMVNAAGVLRGAELRRDFGQMMQGLASRLFGPMFEPFLLPEGLAAPGYRERTCEFLSPEVLAQRWRACLAEQPLRIAYCPGRGPLSEILTALADTWSRLQLPCRVIEVAEPAGVYRLVAQGAFDVVARGWAQDFDDADEFFGIYDKQAPGALANLPVWRFQAQIAAARHQAVASVRREAYTDALLELESQWLCVPICADHKRLFHRPGLRLRPHCHDVFRPFDGRPAATAGPA